VHLEEKYGISFAEEDLSLDLFQNINSIAAYVKEKLAAPVFCHEDDRVVLHRGVGAKRRDTYAGRQILTLSEPDVSCC
jgi:hypothetical protein